MKPSRSEYLLKLNINPLPYIRTLLKSYQNFSCPVATPFSHQQLICHLTNQPKNGAYRCLDRKKVASELPGRVRFFFRVNQKQFNALRVKCEENIPAGK